MEFSKDRIAWKSGYRAAVKPDVAYSVYEQVKECTGNEPTPEAMVSAASEKSCPIHVAFEWDDSIAGHKYRLTQARTMLRSFVMIPEEGRRKDSVRILETIRVTPNTETGEARIAYLPTADVMKDQEARAALLQRALNEFMSLRRRYLHLQELAVVFAEVDAVYQTITFGSVSRKPVAGEGKVPSPTNATPGSREKLAVMRRRAERGLDLSSDDDKR